jgi:hypothetical protein
MLVSRFSRFNLHLARSSLPGVVRSRRCSLAMRGNIVFPVTGAVDVRHNPSTHTGDLHDALDFLHFHRAVPFSRYRKLGMREGIEQ